MTEKPNPDVQPAETAPATRFERFVRFWSRPQITTVAAVLAAIHFVPGRAPLAFAWGMSQTTFAEAPLLASGTILCFYVAPFLAVVFSLLYTICGRGAFNRFLGAAVCVFALYASVWPARGVCRHFEQNQANRLYERFERAVYAADAPEAERIAEKIAELPNRILPLKSKNLYRAALDELNGDDEAAASRYWGLQGDADSLEARARYRLGQNAEAFAAYCRFAEKSAPASGVAAKSEGLRNRALEIAKRRVLFFNGENERSPLESFADYAEFLRFIETEFAKTDDPAKYEKAVQFWRDAEKIDVSAPFEHGSDYFRKLKKPRLLTDDEL